MRKATWVIVLAVCLTGLGASLAQAADKPAAREGRLIAASFQGGKAAQMEAEVTCPPAGCYPGTLQVYVSPRRAKILKRPQVECGEPNRRGVITCTVVKPAKAVYTSCRPKIPTLFELWNTYTTLPEWEESLLTHGSKAEAKDPPMEKAYSFGALPAGPQVLTARVPLKYGRVQACLYLTSIGLEEGFDYTKVFGMRTLR